MTVECVSPQSFHDIAYFAEDRQDLLNGMNEFLDCSIVIPPSDVAGKDLLKTVVDFQKQLLAKKKERDLQRQSSLGLEDHGGACVHSSSACCALFDHLMVLKLFFHIPPSYLLVVFLLQLNQSLNLYFAFIRIVERVVQ